VRILIADDDPVVSAALAAILRTRGHDIVPAFDAMQALMFAMRAPHPDLILLDINMPGGTGITALTKLKASTKTALIPVIVVSGATDAALPARVMSMGAVGFLPKPVQPDGLFRAVNEALGIPEAAG
jgi:CheY-like chemotaxis protein